MEKLSKSAKVTELKRCREDVKPSCMTWNPSF